MKFLDVIWFIILPMVVVYLVHLENVHVALMLSICFYGLNGLLRYQESVISQMRKDIMLIMEDIIKANKESQP